MAEAEGRIEKKTKKKKVAKYRAERPETSRRAKYVNFFCNSYVSRDHACDFLSIETRCSFPFFRFEAFSINIHLKTFFLSLPVPSATYIVSLLRSSYLLYYIIIYVFKFMFLVSYTISVCLLARAFPFPHFADSSCSLEHEKSTHGAWRIPKR